MSEQAAQDYAGPGSITTKFAYAKKHALWRKVAVWYFFLSLASCSVQAQEAWQKIELLSSKNKSLPSLRGIAMKANIVGIKSSVSAYVVLYGHRGSHLVGFGVVVDDMFSIVSRADIEPFLPPDPSSRRVFHICAKRDGLTKCFSGPLRMSSSRLMPEAMRGKSHMCFDLGIEMSDIRCWREFLSMWCDGFQAGYAEIGNGIFQHPLRVEFSGDNVESSLRTLLEFIDK